MLDTSASVNLQKQQLLEHGFRVGDKFVEEVSGIISKIANEDMNEAIKNDSFSFEDIFDFHRANAITELVKKYFYFEKYDFSYSLFGSRNIISNYYFHNNKHYIEQEISKYLISDGLSNKEIKRLDKAFTSRLLDGYYFSFIPPSNNPRLVSFRSIRNTALVILKDLKFTTPSRLTSHNELRSTVQLREDLDIFDRAKKDYFHPQYRKEYYENFMEELVYQMDNAENFPENTTTQHYIDIFNNIENKLFPDDAFEFKFYR